MSDIIISYRRYDSPHMAERVSAFLGDRFGEQFIRFGIDSIRFSRLNAVIEDADALVVLIGQNWLDGDWLNDPNDLNRQALLKALQDPAVIVPALIDGASMPDPLDLPQKFRELVNIAPVTVSDANFREDATDLANRIAHHVNEKRLNPRPRRMAQPEVSPVWTQDKPDDSQPFEGPDPRKAFPGSPQTDRAGTEGTFVDPSASSMPFLNALMYPFTTDKMWLFKIGLVGVLWFIPFLGNAFVLGYCIRMAFRLRDGKAGLPEWNQFNQDLIRGFFVILGIVLHMVIVFLPMLFLSQMVLDLGATESYSEEVGEVIQEPSRFSQQVSLIFQLIAFYFFVIFNSTAMAMYIKTDNYAMMWNFGPMLLEAAHQFARNITFVINVMLFGLTLYVIVVLGLYFYLLPGIFMLGAGTLSYFYLIVYWMKKLDATT